MENEASWHGNTPSKEQCEVAVKELGGEGNIMSKKIATREAYGKALAALANTNENVVTLMQTFRNSTKTADFKAVAPERFFNMGIAKET